MKKIIIVAFSILAAACTTETKEHLLSGEALGTTYQIRYFAEDEVVQKASLDSIFAAINQSMSTYIADSDISRINSGDTSIKVDSMFQKVFFLSKKVHDESSGFFDPTVGDLVNMYGFGPEKALKKIDSSTVDSLMTFVGLDKIQISEEGVVTKEFPQVYIDFNAIAKGYAIDVIGWHLDRQKVDHYLIEVGGELLARGENQNRSAPWTVGIDDPEQTEHNRTLKAVLELKDRAMATSGNYRKFRIDEETGEKYVHTINPLTGFPEKSNLLSATVLADNAALADAYGTAFMALGLEKSLSLLEELEGVDAYLLYATEDGKVAEEVTAGFQEVLLKE